MPKTRRAGRKFQLRKLLAIFHGNPRRSAPYKVDTIDFGEFPLLPPAVLPGVTRDPRERFYVLLREAILHSCYGGAVPATTVAVHWPQHCNDINVLKDTVHKVLEEEITGVPTIQID